MKLPAVTIAAVFFILVGCQTTSEPKNSGNPTAYKAANSKVLVGLSRVIEGKCKVDFEKETEKKKKEFVDLLSVNNMSIASFCGCIAKTFFDGLSQEKLDRIIVDASKFENIAKVEPHKTRILRTTISCVAGVLPGDA
jgi:hypothetical protein